MSNYNLPNPFPLQPPTPADYLDDFTTPGPFPPADLDALSPFPHIPLEPTHTPHHPPSTLDALASTFTPFHSADDPDFLLPSVPDLTLPVTIAPPALDSTLEPVQPRIPSPALVPVPLAPATASPVTPVAPVAPVAASAASTGRRASARGRRGRSRRSLKKEETIQLPPEWESIRDTLGNSAGDVPDAVVKALFSEVRGKAQDIATKEKLKLRNELKNKAEGQHGSPAEISSRREAKVSRKYQEQFKEGVEVQLRIMVTRYCQLWWQFQKTKAQCNQRAEEVAVSRKEETAFVGLPDLEDPVVKKQRLD